MKKLQLPHQIYIKYKYYIPSAFRTFSNQTVLMISHSFKARVELGFYGCLSTNFTEVCNWGMSVKHSLRNFLALQHLLLISGSKLSELGLCTRYCFNSFLSQAPQFKGFPKRKNSLRKRIKKFTNNFVYLFA